MRCSCAALAALHQLMVETLERGSTTDGRRIARNVLIELADRTITSYEASVTRCAMECGVSALDIEQQLDTFVMLGECVRAR